MHTKTKRYRLAIDSELEKALRHAAVAREMTPAGVLLLAAAELLERDGWIRSAEGDDRPSTGGNR